jgi:hypothetical protein
VIFETIAAIKVANEAIGAVKELINNVQSVGQIGSHLTKLTDAEDEIKQKADQGDLDAFFALEKIQQEKANIKQLLIWGGRAGLYDDFIKFQNTRRELREAQAKREAQAIAQRRRQVRDWAIGIAIAVSILSAFGLIGYIFYYISRQG